ncbi:MAG: ABC transporter substrate-binding protein [Eubacterium sp.]
MNKIVKRIVAAGMAVAMVGGVFAGCSANGEKDSNEKKTYKVGICQLVQHDALDAATEGFQAALKEKLGDAVEIDLQNASNDSATCATITNGFVADGVDLIMANATPALQAAMQSTDTIPIVATSVTDFATALEISDWNGTTGINVTGTSDLAPLKEQAAMIKELCPDAKTVGILYCSAEPNSVYQAKVVAEELTKLGISSKEYTAADTNDIASVTQNACDNSDAIYIPTDNTMASATGTIDPIVSDAKIPAVVGEEGICKGCGLATLSISYYSIGYKAGEMAADILQNGADPSSMEIQFAEDLTKKYVADRATALGITVPDTYEAIDMSAE